MKKLVILMIISLFATALSACGGKSDADVQKEVQGRVRTPGVTAAVKEGVVTLTGTVTTQAERDAAVAAARGEGVKDVKDSIMIKPPMTPMMPAATPMMSPMTNGNMRMSNSNMRPGTTGSPMANRPRL